MLTTSSIVYSLGLPGGSEMLIILLIVVILFGHNKLPLLGDALGKSIQNFRKSFKGDDTESAEVIEAKVVENEEKIESKKEEQARLED